MGSACAGGDEHRHVIDAGRRLSALRGSPTARQFVHAAAWSAAGEALSRGLLLLALVAAARALGADAYGQLGIVRSTINLFATIGGMGLGLMANRYVAEHRDSNREFSGQIIGA